MVFHRFLSDSRTSGTIERLWLLGIDWGHLPVWSDVVDGDGEINGRIKTNTGMAGVVPSWKLKELIESTDLASQRDLAESNLAR